MSEEPTAASEEDALHLIRLIDGLGMKVIALQNRATQHHWTSPAFWNALEKAIELGWIEYLEGSASVQLTEIGAAKMRELD